MHIMEADRIIGIQILDLGTIYIPHIIKIYHLHIIIAHLTKFMHMKFKWSFKKLENMIWEINEE